MPSIVIQATIQNENIFPSPIIYPAILVFYRGKHYATQWTVTQILKFQTFLHRSVTIIYPIQDILLLQLIVEFFKLCKERGNITLCYIFFFFKYVNFIRSLMEAVTLMWKRMLSPDPRASLINKEIMIICKPFVLIPSKLTFNRCVRVTLNLQTLNVMKCVPRIPNETSWEIRKQHSMVDVPRIRCNVTLRDIYQLSNYGTFYIPERCNSFHNRNKDVTYGRRRRRKNILFFYHKAKAYETTSTLFRLEKK